MINFLSSQSICFFIISAIVIFTACVATFSKNIKVSLFCLFFTFFGISGYYVLLYSEFLAIMQVLIYVGAILALLLFGALLIDDKFMKGESKKKIRITSFIFICIYFLLIPLNLIYHTLWSAENKVIKKSFDATSMIGELLVSNEFIILEVVGILMLLSLIGASLIIKKDK